MLDIGHSNRIPNKQLRPILMQPIDGHGVRRGVALWTNDARAMMLDLLRRSFGLALLALLAAACGTAPRGSDEAADVPDPAARDSALAVLDGLDEAPFRAAFERLPELPHRRFQRTSQRDAEGHLRAVARRTFRFAPGNGLALVASDTSGAFDYGYLAAFADADDAEPAAPTELLDALLPEDPAYLAARTRSAFRYRLRPDTVLWQRPARVVEIRAAPGEGDGQNIRRARLYLDAETGALVALSLSRRGRALFFGETTDLYAGLRPAEGGTWLPHQTHVRTRLDGPLRPPQRLETLTAYYAFAPPP